MPSDHFEFKKDFRTADFQFNEPTSKFIRPPFLLTPYMSRITYNPCPEGCGGFVSHRDIISEP